MGQQGIFCSAPVQMPLRAKITLRHLRPFDSLPLSSHFLGRRSLAQLSWEYLFFLISSLPQSLSEPKATENGDTQHEPQLLDLAGA